LSEATGADELQFGTERLAKALTELSHLPAEQICNQLWNQVKAFVGEHPQSDDITAIVIRRLSLE
jgi:serine phosphatase RsbU (regulator of sigma subunit)